MKASLLTVLIMFAFTAYAKVCTECHEAADVLPKEHEKVVFALPSCLDCHEGTAEGANDNFASGIHLKHADVNDCADCHISNGERPFAIQGAKRPGRETQEQELITEKMKNWQKSVDLDNMHAQSGVFCSGCHGAELPEFAAEVDNSVCLACHGPLEDLQKKTEPLEDLQKKTEPLEFKDRNPHKSHLGDVACTICHHAHSAQEIYCISCHPKFEMKLPDKK